LAFLRSVLLGRVLTKSRGTTSKTGNTYKLTVSEVLTPDQAAELEAFLSVVQGPYEGCWDAHRRRCLVTSGWHWMSQSVAARAGFI
jgi:hypothetical protein